MCERENRVRGREMWIYIKKNKERAVGKMCFVYILYGVGFDDKVLAGKVAK